MDIFKIFEIPLECFILCKPEMEDSRLVIIEADSKDFHSDWYDVVLIDRLAKETNTAILVLIDSHININFSFKSMFEVKKERDVLYIESVKNTLVQKGNGS